MSEDGLTRSKRLEAAENIRRALGKNVRSYRKAAGMKQGELADLVGLSRPSIVNIEQGKQEITGSYLCFLAVALRVRPGDLLSDHPRGVD